MDQRYIVAGLLALMFGNVLFGLVQYQAYNRTWGLKLILWATAAAALAGVALKYKFYVASAWFALGFALASLIGWWWLGGKCSGWRRHLVRAVAFAVCLGPLAGVPGAVLPVLGAWLKLLGRLPAREIRWTVSYGLPGLCLMAALAFVASVLAAALAERRLPPRRLRWVAAAAVLSLLPMVNWYAAGFVDVVQAAMKGEDRRLWYACNSRPGFANGRTWPGAAGMTPLQGAAFLARSETVGLLLRAGADVNAGGESGATALHWAMNLGEPHLPVPIYRRTATVRALLAAGAAPDIKNGLGLTPLYFAAQIVAPDIVKALLAAGADPNAKDSDGDTALHWTALYGPADVARVLLRAGAAVNARNRSGQTPLDRAGDSVAWAKTGEETTRRHAQCVELLRQHGGKTGKELAAERTAGPPLPGESTAPAPGGRAPP